MARLQFPYLSIHLQPKDRLGYPSLLSNLVLHLALGLIFVKAMNAAIDTQLPVAHYQISAIINLTPYICNYKI